MGTGDVLWRAHGERLAKVLQTSCAWERDLRIGIDGTNQVSIGYRQSESGTDAVCEKERLIEFPLPQSVRMQSDGHEHIEIQMLGERLQEQRTQRVRQSDLPSIFEEGNGILERRTIGIGGPYLRIVRLASAAVLAFVRGTVGQRRGRSEGTMTSRAGGTAQRPNQIPARAAEKRHRIVPQGSCTTRAVHWQQQPRGLPEKVHHHCRLHIVDVRPPFSLVGLSKERSRPVKVVACKGGVI